MSRFLGGPWKELKGRYTAIMEPPWVIPKLTLWSFMWHQCVFFYQKEKQAV